MKEHEFEFAVVTNRGDEFTRWARTSRIPTKRFSGRIYNEKDNIRYISITSEDMVRGFRFNGIIVPDFVNKNTENYQKIMDAIDWCFTR